MVEFTGKIQTDVRDSERDWAPYVEPTAPTGAPNVLFIVWDDMGYGSWDLYGGLIRMPNMGRIADQGVRFTQFHTTALCSPSRASLLTGRNAQSTGMGTIGEFSDGFPNLSCLIPAQNAFLPEMLRECGYNTFAIGKWHLTPASELSMGASKRTWPLSRGFDRFYGFLGGLSDQWYPDLTYDNHAVEAPATPEEGYHLSKDLVDRSIQFIRDSRATAPDKPWFTYLAPGACHAPHHVFTEWADQYRGDFSMGYDAYRDVVLANQKRLGLMPENTALPPRNPYEEATGADGQPWNASDLVRPWDSLSEGEQRLYERQAEVYAGYASYTDHQIGRLLDYLRDSDQLDNTLIVVISDNGASAEGGPNGSVNENRWYNYIPEDLQANLDQLSELGSQSTHPHFSNGWAMAFDTPFKLYKTNASFEGGIADPMIVSWPAGVGARAQVRHQYVHVTDVLPTVLECIGVPAPDRVGGWEQQPLEGVSFLAALADADADTGKTEQFYCMLGTRGVWSQGWHASTVHPPSPSDWSHFDQDQWQLFYLPEDRNQTNDLAQQEPDKLGEMQQLWHELAQRYNGYPLDDRGAAAVMSIQRPGLMTGRTTMTLHPGGAPVPERGAVEISGRSFSVTADVDLTGHSQGVIYSLGSRFGGHVLFIQDQRLIYVYNWLGEEEQRLEASAPLPSGRATLGVTYDATDQVEIPGTPFHYPTGQAALLVNGQIVGTRALRTQPAYFNLSGEGATVGREIGQSVSTAYEPPFTFTAGTIHQVTVDVGQSTHENSEQRHRQAHARD